MTIAERISNICHQSNQQGKGVLPPQVCPYCFSCPIATIVAGVSGNNYQTGAIPIPDKDKESVESWLDKIEGRIS